jgi:miniconductance mechanosensitive channel
MASIQIAMNNMVSVGDWVSVPQYGADGTILEINLVTVKVKNWDQTISTVPTYAFISDSFVNWRGMEESGGRRIKQHLYINNKTIKFADEELIARLKKIQILKPYLESKIIEIEEFNKLKNADKSELANGRHLTNIGIFRKYASLYIESHPMINENMTRMVRQLQSTNEGLPLEVYCFSIDKAWVNYEGIKADIFDHLFAVAKKFDLEVFQKPSGSDFQNAFQLKN